MKYLCIVALLLSTACTSKTEFGDCIGINGGENPALEYKYSKWNIAMAFVISSMILPPIFVVVDEVKCPVGKK